MEQSSPTVQYRHFQLSQLPRIDVEKNATRNRRRENSGKIEADVEPDVAFFGKLSYSAELECIQSPGMLNSPSQEGSNLITQCASIKQTKNQAQTPTQYKIAYIHNTSDYSQHCHVGHTQHCRLGLFQDSDCAGDLEESQSTSGGILCILGSRTLVPRL